MGSTSSPCLSPTGWILSYGSAFWMLLFGASFLVRGLVTVLLLLLLLL